MQYFLKSKIIRRKCFSSNDMRFFNFRIIFQNFLHNGEEICLGLKTDWRFILWRGGVEIARHIQYLLSRLESLLVVAGVSQFEFLRSVGADKCYINVSVSTTVPHVACIEGNCVLLRNC